MAYLLTTAILALCVVTFSAAADVLTGRVVHVIDGDGLIVLLADKRVNVRLEHIDAPERGQPYGTHSRQSLIAICGGKLATVNASGKDRNGRTLARC
jgi:endonuclease YncB( thermonuclease family)